MLNQELAQRAVMEALEGKIRALRAADELAPDTVLELYFWDDLAQTHSSIFSTALPNDIAEAIAAVEKQSLGLFKLESLKPSVAIRDVLRVAHLEKDGRPLDISNLYWRIQYNQKTMPNIERKKESRGYWLTPRELYTEIAGNRKDFSFEPNGKQYKILECLAESNSFIDTKTIADKAETTERNVATQIADLKKKAGEAFGLGETDFIQSSRGEGYRLGAAIRIIIEK